MVTIEQLVTFTAGFPAPANNLSDPQAFGTSAARCAEFAKWELAWAPGSRWEYHALSAHWYVPMAKYCTHVCDEMCSSEHFVATLFLRGM